MQTLNSHKLNVERNPYGAGYVGDCDTCSDPDWTDEGVWVGQVTFHAHTEEGVRELHEDHVVEEAE